jgi:hypothetical protein
MFMPPRSGEMGTTAFCLDNGRWSKRDSEEVTNFGASANVIAGRDLKLAAKSAESQGEVWRQVAVAQDKLSANTGTRVNGAASPTSFQLALENKEVQKTSDSYFKALAGIINGKSDVIGYVFAINGKINSAAIYASNSIFQKLWPKFMEQSSIEAGLELCRAKNSDAPRPDVQGF